MDNVKIIDVIERHTDLGVAFLVFLVAGGFYNAISRTSKREYTALLTTTVSVPSGMSAEQARMLIGTTIPGRIERIPRATPREFVNSANVKCVSLHDYRLVAA